MAKTMDTKSAARKGVDYREAGKRFVRVFGSLFDSFNPLKSPFYVAGQRNSDRRMKLKAMQEQKETVQRNEDRASLREQRDSERERFEQAMRPLRAENEYLRNQLLKEQLRQQKTK